MNIRIFTRVIFFVFALINISNSVKASEFFSFGSNKNKQLSNTNWSNLFLPHIKGSNKVIFQDLKENLDKDLTDNFLKNPKEDFPKALANVENVVHLLL